MNAAEDQKPCEPCEQAPGQAQPQSPGKSAKERHYLQKISELEEVAAKLRAQLAAVQAREAILNESAKSRGAALRYATAAVTAAGGPGIRGDAVEVMSLS